jgi:alkanesulfonate monooxygenase SsuD/methylene tetrahydromethanopterin reductase-like flavin-dependent oxidoreductase (luciferase family)
MSRSRPLEVGFKTRQAGVDWPTLAAVWEQADDLPAFSSGWLWDHFTVGLESTGGGSLEALTLATALAGRTDRLRLGHMVLGNTHRDPAILAWMAATLDHVAEGRFILGLGAGWHADEHRALGLRLSPIGERIGRLRDAVRAMRGIWQAREAWSFEGEWVSLASVRMEPEPFTPGGPPIWLGTQGRARGLRIVAELADGWITNAGLVADFVPLFRELRDALARHCADVGRDLASLTIAVQLPLDGRPDDAVIAEATELAREGANLVAFVVDARLGPPEIQRVAREIAAPLLDAFG